MKKINDLREEIVVKICQDFLNGAPLKEIAEETGYTDSHVRNILCGVRNPLVADSFLRREAANCYEKYVTRKKKNREKVEKEVQKTRNEIIDTLLRYRMQTGALEEKLKHLRRELERYGKK